MRFGVLLMVLASLAMPAFAADVDGKWVGSLTTAGGDVQVAYNFKAEGEKLTGSAVGPDGMELPIKEGKIEGNNISFNISIDFGGMPFTLSYKGVVAPDQVKLNFDMLGQPFEMVLKKDAATK